MSHAAHCVRFCAAWLIAVPACCSTASGQAWAPRAEESTPARGPLAVLVRSPDTSRGQPPFALVDQDGELQRHVEPTPGIDLAAYVGQRVRVKHDTGETLLATQLELPAGLRSLGEGQSPRLEPLPTGAVRTAQFEDDPTAPIVLEDVLAEEAGERSVLPGPAERFEEDALDTATDPLAIEPDGATTHETLPPPSSGGYRTKSTQPWIGAAPLGVAASQDCTRRGKQGRCVGPTCDPPSRRGPYGRVDFLLWWFDDMTTPPLVTGGTVASQGVLGADGTTVLHGGEVLGDSRDGLRLTLGGWLDNERDFAIEGDAIWIEDLSETFAASDISGATVIARPYFDVNTLAEASRLISFPSTWAGSVSVTERSEFESYALRLRTGLACRELGGGCATGDCRGGTNGVSRVDFVTGYRYTSLDESLVINESRAAIGSTPNTFSGTDLFETQNDFHGVDLGFVTDWETRRWTAELVSRIALGRITQKVSISGSSVSNGAPQTGNLLTQTSNIGAYERDRFSVLPELSARIAYRVTPHVRLGLGYSLVYWANVVRPGDQIDRDVDLTAPSVRPQFAFRETDVWAHGLSFSIDGEY